MQRVALVTGGMGGLGEAICIKLAALGYKVVTTHTPSNTRTQEWLQAMNNMGFGFKAYPCDVADYDSCKACVETIEQDVGAIDVLVNNAGITRDMTFKKMTKDDWNAVIRTNLDSVFNMTKQVLDGMVDRNWGRVINVSSVNGQNSTLRQRRWPSARWMSVGLPAGCPAMASGGGRKLAASSEASPDRADPCAGQAIPAADSGG